MPQQAEPGEDAVVFPEMRRELFVDEVDRRQFIVLLAFQLLSEFAGSVIERHVADLHLV